MIRYLALFFLTAIAATAACERSNRITQPDVLFYRNGEPIVLASRDQAAIHAKILDTVRATSLGSTSYAGSEDKWNELAQNSFLLLIYDQPNVVTAHWDRQIPAMEILIPLSNDSHYLLRNSNSGEYWAFTKFIPKVRADLICHHLLLVEENKGFCNFMEQRGDEDAPQGGANKE